MIPTQNDSPRLGPVLVDSPDHCARPRGAQLANRHFFERSSDRPLGTADVGPLVVCEPDHRVGVLNWELVLGQARVFLVNFFVGNVFFLHTRQK